MNQNRIIVHALIENQGKYLVIKRSNKEDSYPNYWDIPGGMVEMGELPRNALIRETKEEVNLDIFPINPIHEDSNLDEKKDMIFIRLVYLSHLKDSIDNIILDTNEHTDYKFVSNIKELNEELVVPYLKEIFQNINK